jgi:hypothetical protein
VSHPSAPPANPLENRSEVSRGAGEDPKSFASSSEGPSRRVYDSVREGAAPTLRTDSERGSTREGKGASETGPDLSHWGRPVRTPVPTLRDSSDTFHAAPVRGGGLSSIDRPRAPSSRLDRESILDRYKGREGSGIPGNTLGGGAQPRTPEPSRPRGIDPRSGGSAGKPARPGDRAGTGPSQRRTPPLSPPLSTVPKEPRHDDSRTLPGSGQPKKDSKEIGSRARDKSQLESIRRLDRLARQDPKTASKILEKGRQITVATDAAVRTAVGVGVSFGGGGSSGSSCFWDPCHAWTGHCAPFWNWWWSPSCSWWWSSCCMPWYGCGYGCWPYNCGSWYGGYYGCGPSVCYAPYPVYYSSVIYDAYSPPAPEPEIVYVEQPAAPVAEAAEAPAAPAAMGEGSIQVAAPGQEGSGVSGRGGAQSAASQRLSLGDEAFREGRYSDAVHEYAKAVELEPREGVLHLILSDALFATGDYHYAAYALRRALELDPTLVDSVIDKHSFYGDATEFDRQLQLLESYLEDHFLDDDARLLLAANYLFGAKPAQAADLLQSPFSQTMRETAAGKVLLERTNKLQHEPPPAVAAPK